MITTVATVAVGVLLGAIGATIIIAVYLGVRRP